MTLGAQSLAPVKVLGSVDGMRGRWRLALPALFGLVLACGDFKSLIALQQDLAREFQSSMKISVGSGRLTVLFTNSNNANLPELERAQFARHVAEFVRDHYSAYDQLESIQVGFATVRGGGGFTFSTSSVPYRFATSELGASRNRADAEPRVLVIMISRANRHNVWLTTGRTEDVDSMLRIVPDDSGATPITLRQTYVRNNAFAPNLLPRVAARDNWVLANKLSKAVVRCIPMFVDDEPRNVKAVPGFLGSLVSESGERILLMAQ